MNQRDVYMPTRNLTDPYVSGPLRDNSLNSKFSGVIGYKKSQPDPDLKYPVQKITPPTKSDQNGYLRYIPSKESTKLIPEPNTEAQEINFKIQKYKEDQLKKLIEKRRDQKELKDYYIMETNKKQEIQKNLMNEKQRSDLEYNSLARASMEREKNFQLFKKEQMLRIAEENNKNSFERKKFEKTANLLDPNDAKKIQSIYLKGPDPNGQNYLDKLKSFESQSIRKKPSEKIALQPDPLKYKVSPSYNNLEEPINANNKEEEVRNRLLLLEEKRRKEKEIKPKIDPKGDQAQFEMNLKNFFGVDEANPGQHNGLREASPGELPSSSEFKQIETQSGKASRFAKTNLKSLCHDPITGTINNYVVDRPKPRPLGTKPPDVFPGKINDSPPQGDYEFPKFTKKAPRNQIFNPLTGETQMVKVENKPAMLSPSLESLNSELLLTEKIGKSKINEIPVSNPPPIYKGMGYKKSSIFA
jgi:hypothetical protein